MAANDSSLKLKVVLGTWNVHEKDPSRDLMKDVKEWLSLESTPCPDIVAIGFQEIEMTAGAMLAEETQQKSKWEDFLKSLFDQVFYFKNRENAENLYTQICSYQLVGLYLTVFVRNKHMKRLSDMRYVIQREGFVGLGNKGAIGVSFKLYDKRFCFFDVHLAAHDGNVEQRSQSLQTIINDTAFSSESIASSMYITNFEDTPMSPPSNEDVFRSNPVPSNIVIPVASSCVKVRQHDYAFLFGDFNYRISPQGEMTMQDVKQKIKEGRWAVLRQCDQLTNEMKRGKILKDFKEGLVNFAPTYKYKAGTHEYSETKKRMPSWTDRIFHYDKSSTIGGADTIEQLFYGRFESLLSDHKPVSSVLMITLVGADSPSKPSIKLPPTPVHLLQNQQHQTPTAITATTTPSPQQAFTPTVPAMTKPTRPLPVPVQVPATTPAPALTPNNTATYNVSPTAQQPKQSIITINRTGTSQTQQVRPKPINLSTPSKPAPAVPSKQQQVGDLLDLISFDQPATTPQQAVGQQPTPTQPTRPQTINLEFNPRASQTKMVPTYFGEPAPGGAAPNPFDAMWADPFAPAPTQQLPQPAKQQQASDPFDNPFAQDPFADVVPMSKGSIIQAVFGKNNSVLPK